MVLRAEENSKSDEHGELHAEPNSNLTEATKQIPWRRRDLAMPEEEAGDRRFFGNRGRRGFNIGRNSQQAQSKEVKTSMFHCCCLELTCCLWSS